MTVRGCFAFPGFKAVAALSPTRKAHSKEQRRDKFIFNFKFYGKQFQALNNSL